MGNFLTKAYFFFYLFALVAPQISLGGRELVLPPVGMFTVHGGIRHNGTDWIGCTSADLLPQSLNAPFEDGVRYSNHSVVLNLSNVSSSPQTINVMLKGNGSAIKSHNSNGFQLPIPGVAGATLELSDWTSPDYVIPANSSSSVSFVAGCTNSNCQIISNLGTTRHDVSGSSVFAPVGETGCGGVPQTCISQTTTLVIVLKVKEDRGVIVGHLTTAAHRCSGYKDHYIMPPLNFSLNGGKAF